jgi:hypothetical protein
VQKTVEAGSMAHVFKKDDALAIDAGQKESLASIPKDFKQSPNLKQKDVAALKKEQPDLSTYVGFTKIELPKATADSLMKNESVAEKTETTEVVYAEKNCPAPGPMAVTPAPNVNSSFSKNLPVVSTPAKPVINDAA